MQYIPGAYQVALPLIPPNVVSSVSQIDLLSKSVPPIFSMVIKFLLSINVVTLGSSSNLSWSPHHDMILAKAVQTIGIDSADFLLFYVNKS